MIENILSEIGLNQSEIKVYLALLELGESKAGEIIKKSKLNSGRIYEIFDSLQKKGFISHINKSGIKYFSPTDPRKLSKFISVKENKIKRQKKDFDSLLPEIMKKINSKKINTNVEVYIGFDGM